MTTALWAAALTLATDPAPRPNIVFLLIDDLGRADCGFMGGKTIRTPHIDKLAAQGVRLDAHYVQPVCTPTRAALLTGRYPMRHGLQVGVIRPWAKYGLPLAERTLPQALREVGYATGIFGKWHLGHFEPAYLPTQRGFERQYGHYNGQIDCFTHIRDGGFDWHRDDRACRDAGYSTELIAREACAFIGEHAGKRPYFCYAPFNAVHAPLQAPEAYGKLYPEFQGQRRAYAQMLTALDDAVGRIVAAVDAAGARSQTLFVFSSDNGGPNPGRVADNGALRAGKATVYEGGVRSAAFATWDGVLKPGSSQTGTLHVVDWYPTLLGLAGVDCDKQPQPVDGLDQWKTLKGEAPSPRVETLINVTPNVGALRVQEWKLIVRQGEDDPDDGQLGKKKAKGKRLGEAVELFNLDDDPNETNNLAAAHPDRVAALRERLRKYAESAVPPKARPKPKDFVAPRVWGESDRS